MTGTTAAALRKAFAGATEETVRAERIPKIAVTGVRFFAPEED